MTSAATLLLLTAALSAPEPFETPDADFTADVDASEVVAPDDELETSEAFTPDELAPKDDGLALAGSGDPLYERLFGSDEDGASSEQGPHMPTMPAWLWLVSAGGLAGLYFWRQRRKTEVAGPGQIEILGHTRVGPKSRLTVVRVAGADGTSRRLLLSTGEGAPALVADLGAEASPTTETPTAPAAPTFARALQGELAGPPAPAVDEAPRAEEIEEEDGAGVVPPPRVPVWNETPAEFRAALQHTEPSTPAQPSAPPQPAVQPEPSAQVHDPLADLQALLGEDDAPELAVDIHWDSEDGWYGLPTAASEHGAPEPPPVLDERPIEEPTEPDPWPTGASRAAFEALLSNAPRSLERPTRREPFAQPEVRVVKPMRPWQVVTSRRTPYDDVAEEEAPARGHVLARSSAEVQDLVAEVLREREEAPAAHSEHVVDLAGYARRRVQR